MIIRSILDTDLYKFSMSYAYQQLFPKAVGEFKFVDRNETDFDENFLKEFELGLAEMCSLQLSKEEVEEAFKLTGAWIPLHYWEWLKTFKFDRNKIKVKLDEYHRLQITVEDLLYKATLYEVPLLALVSEVRNRWRGYSYNQEKLLSDLSEKIKLSNKAQLRFSEFGTRRRYSSAIQEIVCDVLSKDAEYYVGTSNVYDAIRTKVKTVGTMAHEFISANAAFYGYRMGNYMTLENWAKVYWGNLGIALTDTFSNKIFFQNFDRRHAKLFDGVRHDSGDPYRYISMVVNRYKELGIDPKSKTIVFSNALTMPEFNDISDACKGRINCAAGIGTNLTGIPEQVSPSNIVMKLWKVRMNETQPWIHTVKISDDYGKATGDTEEVKLAKLTLKI